MKLIMIAYNVPEASAGPCKLRKSIIGIYRQVSNIRRTKFKHLIDSRTVLRLPLPNPLKPYVESRMKM